MSRKKDEALFGKANEEYFFQAFSKRPRDAPEWFVSMRRATKREDRNGFDAFLLTTNVGEIPIQIKSSTQGIIRFFSKRKGNPAILIVAVAGVNPEGMRKKVFELVEKRRWELLAVQ